MRTSLNSISLKKTFSTASSSPPRLDLFTGEPLTPLITTGNGKTVKWQNGKETSAPAISGFYNFTVLPPYRFTTLPFYHLTVLPPYRFTTLPSYLIRAN
jgi:hypothetical protein